ncbi:hypothetical protein [Falsiroseomonas sp.]|uniref:hypothetical protein n=1 Tax=Falsiroseomonas sp. TaxID=2870721 RepID=UPI0034A40513
MASCRFTPQPLTGEARFKLQHHVADRDRGPGRAHPISRREDAERQGLDWDIGMAMRQGDDAAPVGELRGIQHRQLSVGSNALWTPSSKLRQRA